MGARCCPHCGAQVSPEGRFCSVCGKAIGEVSAAVDKTLLSSLPTLVVRWPDGHTEEHPLSKPTTRVGRAPSNDIVLAFPTVSNHHLEIALAADGVSVTDLGSTNGTQVGGQTIPPHRPHPWPAGTAVRIGDLRGNSLSMDLGGAGVPTSRTQFLAPSELAQADRVLVGRDPSCQVHLDHPSVSRHHAEIRRRDGRFEIRDAGSTNGTYVNGQRVTDWTALGPGDELQIGPFQLGYDAATRIMTGSMAPGHCLDAIGLGMQVSGERMILNDISLSVQAGEFAALVGGSGAGKSTLLKAMNGFSPATHGQMLIDGQDLYASLDRYRTMMGYVPQDDIIHRGLPVYSALWYAAKLRLPDASADEIDERIERVLEMVDMTEHAEKPVRVLSGGQRKRVSIAAELLAEPALLFLDEPTSGLDPGLEKKMMYDLSRLADQGKTVLLVTHATANIDQCDQVAFLAKGQLAYYGPPNEAVPFFEAQDFADIYLRLSEGPNAGLLWAERYRKHPLYKESVLDRQPKDDGTKLRAPRSARRQRSSAGSSLLRSLRALLPRRTPGVRRDSALRQLVVLARRHFALIRHDAITLFILLLMMPFIAALFMAVSNEDDLVGWGLTPAEVEEQLVEELEGKAVDEKAEYVPAPGAQLLITMFGLALTQAGTFGAAFEIVKERPIFRRERAVNLKVVAYVGSKVLVLAVFTAVQVASSLWILGLRVDLDFEPIYEFFPSGVLELATTLFIAVLASVMFGLFISAVVPNQNVVLYVILGQLFLQIILSGALFPLPDSAVTDGVSKLVVSYWAMDAMGSTVGLHELNEESQVCRVTEYEVPGSAETKTEIICDSAAVPEEDLGLDYERSAEHLRTTWIALSAQAVAWGVLTVLVLTFRKPS